MNNYFNSYCGGISLAFLWSDPGAFKRTSDAEQMLKYGRKPGQKGPLKPERGDKFIAIGAVVGMVIGGTAAAMIGYQQSGVFTGFIYCIGGIIVGGFIGATIGSLIKKWRVKTGKKSQDGENSDFPHLNND